MLERIITGGSVVTPEGVSRLDVGIKEGRIAALEAPGSLEAGGAERIDVEGMFVLPGGIETHAHIGIPVPEFFSGRPDVFTQPPEAASRAAAFGGVTTIMDFAGRLADVPGDPPADPILGQLEARKAAFHGHSYTDYAFHYILTGAVPQSVIDEIPEAVQAGVASFKVFETHFPGRIPFGHLWAVFQKVTEARGLVAVHSEEPEIIAFMRDKLKAERRDQAENIYLVHNNVSEDTSFTRIIQMARHTQTPVYFVHTSAAEGVNAIAKAREDGLPVYGETLHNYLEFTSDHYHKPGGTAIHTYPSVKSSTDRAALQDGLAEGIMSTVATDEYTTHKDVKTWGNTIETLCGGHNGIETRLPVTYTKLVASGKISVERFAELVASNPAKILGLYPQKGVIAIGSDADLAVFDPRVRRTIRTDELHAESDYSIWDGFVCEGYPVMTILRGKPIVRDGKLIGSEKDGKWLPRKIGERFLTSPSA